MFGVGFEELDVVVVVLDWRDCGPARVPVEVGVLGRACGPVRALVDAEVLGAVGKKLSDVLITGEKRIFLVALHASFSFCSSSELYIISGFLYQSG